MRVRCLASGRIVTYARYAMGRITGVTTKKDAAAAVVTLASSIDYMPVSRLVKSFTYGNGLIDMNGYTLDYETSALEVKNGAANVCSTNLSRTDNLNVTALTDNVTSANNQTFGYSAANRLTSASGAYGAQSWTYDGVGNRLSENSTPVGGSLTARTYTYPTTSNRISSTVIAAATERAFTYDGAGNIASDTRNGTAYTYAYNKRNRLNTVTVAGSLKGTYTYNGMEQLAIRVSTNQTPAGTTHFIHDHLGNVIAETAGNGPTGATGTVREYIYLPETEIAPTMGSRTVVDRPLAVVDAVNTASPVTWYVHADHLHRPIRMTDAAKASVWTAVWAPWGAPHSITGSATLNARFPGQWFQMEAGLHYNWHRSYDPSLGRYTQPDPLGFVDGPSLMAYVKSNPIRSTDQRGLTADVQRCGIPKRRPLYQCTKEFPNDGPQKWWQTDRDDANNPVCYQKCAQRELTACQPATVVLCAPVGAVGGVINGLGCFAVTTYICSEVADMRCKWRCDCLNNDLH